MSKSTRAKSNVTLAEVRTAEDAVHSEQDAVETERAERAAKLKALRLAKEEADAEADRAAGDRALKGGRANRTR